MANVDCGILIRGAMKQCSKCKEWKLETEFHKSKIYKDGLITHCKKCKSEYGMKHYADNKDKKAIYNSSRKNIKRSYDKEYYASIKDGKRQDWLLSTKQQRQAYQLKELYGITLEDKQRLLELQNGVCAICGGDNKGRELHVDHAHDGTKRVRGLLCMSCNNGLGLFKDNQKLLTLAIEYLGR